MPQLFKSPVSNRSPRARSVSLGALRLAPWVVFGPITGVMSEAAIAAFKRGRPGLAGLYVLLNIGILVSMPVLTALLLPHH
jgi:hypothetical protein